MAMSDWLYESPLPDAAAVEACLDGVFSDGERSGDNEPPLPTYAVRIGEITLTQSTWKALLGGPDVRLDVLAISGNQAILDLADVAQTFHFPGVGTRKNLPVSEAGFVPYVGRPTMFLAFAVIASRYRADVADLPALLREPSVQERMSDPMERLYANPPRDVASTQAAMAAAQSVLNIALRAVRAACPASVGLFQDHKLESPDMFGYGRNPAAGAYQRGGLSLWYEVLETDSGVRDGLQPRLVVAMDVVGYSDRSEPAMHAVQKRLDSIVVDVLRELPEPLIRVPRQDIGDAINLVPPSTVRDYSTLVPAFIDAIRRRLAADNAENDDRIRMRMSMEIGMIRPARLGFSGDAIVTAARLLNSGPARRAIIDTESADLALIVSEYVHRELVRHDFPGLDSTWFEAVTVQEKTFAAPAWLWAPA